MKWVLLAVVLAWLAWRIVILGMAGQAALHDRQPEVALAWFPGYAQAHLDLGLRDLESRPDEAIGHLRAAIGGNPADSRGYAGLGRLLDAAGEKELARRAMETADRMGPQRSDVQLDLTVYWIRQEDFPRALRHWNSVLRHQPGLHGRLFPYLLNGAEDPANQAAFAELLQKPVPWWAAFFSHAASHAESIDTVRRLFNLSRAGVNPLTAEALGAYLTRLQNEGLWIEAWFVWMNSLSKEAMAQSGHVFNGSFELPPSNLGFDWIYQKTPAVVMETSTTYGTTGERALHLVFRGLRIRFQHLYQYLLLPPGSYQLQGRVRPDNLKSAQGMQWALYCVGRNEPLVVTERFNGLDQWRRFRATFTVPPGCSAQMLRLELAGRIALDYDVSGGIWFDDLAVEQVGRRFAE